MEESPTTMNNCKLLSTGKDNLKQTKPCWTSFKKKEPRRLKFKNMNKHEQEKPKAATQNNPNQASNAQNNLVQQRKTT